MRAILEEEEEGGGEERKGERKRASGCLARVMYLPERKGHLHTADSTCTQPAQGEANGSALVLPSDRWKSNLSFIHPAALSRRIIGISSRVRRIKEDDRSKRKSFDPRLSSFLRSHAKNAR